MGDLVPLLIIAAAAIFSAINARDSRGHIRLFWSLIATGLTMWCFNQACWVWFEVLVRKPVPEPFQGDIVLFLHVVPITAAVAILPHQTDEHDGMLPSALNVLILLVWWVVIYAFFVFPEEYIALNVGVYSPRWDFLYLVEGLILIAISASAYFTSSGLWRELYRDILIASVLYTLSAEAMNSAIARGAYKSGGLYDLPFVAAALGFLWVAVAGRYRLRDVPMILAQRRPTRPIATH